jgi:hypothetical protein
MHARDTARTPRSGNAARGPEPAPATRGPALSASSLLALQRSAGNTAVVQMLRQAGHPWAQEQHQHGAGCGHQQAGQPAVQRAAVHDVLRSGGQPLDSSTRTDMEARLGADFSDVRLHTDSAARESAAGVGARAYTSGNHVVIGSGGGDKHTLAHELTHVIQQRQGPVAGTDNGSGLSVSDPSDRFEREAESNATRVMSGPVQRAQPAAEGEAASAPAAVQRATGPVAVQRTTMGSALGTYVSAHFSEQMKELAEKVGTSPENCWNAMLDPAYDPEGAHEIAPQILDENLKDPISYASCFPTARALFPILTTKEEEHAAAQGPNPMRCANVAEFQAANGSLIQALRTVWGEGHESVFRIEFGGHGFTLVIRKPPGGEAHLELIESLAHAAGIIPSLQGPGMSFDVVTAALQKMAADDVATRVEGAHAMGWNAHALYLGDPQRGEQEHYPNTRMRWWRSPLSDDAGSNWMGQITRRFNFIARTYGTTQIPVPA